MSRPFQAPASDAERRHAALVQEVSRRVREALDGAHAVDADHAALTVERAPRPAAPERLARAHPGGAGARQQARGLYERCLVHYREVLRASQADGAVDDVGAALAAFVAANLRAVQGVDLGPPAMQALERQLAGVLRGSPGWVATAARERQMYFEQLAILAVLVSESFTQAVLMGPAALANVQRAARGYLQQLLGLQPHQLVVGEHGLALAG
ncbi:MAG TPA: DUF6683 family protein [Albitalea sp.]|uniref:DUF6683 family protein n=1 Tax=Piscinibacter sp. TaxID=1903157 RepID=UPI002ED58620